MSENILPKKNILIVEDELSIADNIRLALDREGMHSFSCHLGSDALDALKQEKIDLVTLDIGLPDMTGIEVCRRIREFSRVPVIFLTARDDEIDKVLGLELGADDYLVKPFSPRELVARINAVLRRVETKAVRDPADDVRKLLVIDDEIKEISYKGNPLQLTPHEFGILQALAEFPGRVCSRESLLTRVWKDDLDVNDRVVDTHIKSIRAKVADLNKKSGEAGSVEEGSGLIKTHRGFGYSLARELLD